MREREAGERKRARDTVRLRLVALLVQLNSNKQHQHAGTMRHYCIIRAGKPSCPYLSPLVSFFNSILSLGSRVDSIGTMCLRERGVLMAGSSTTHL